MIFDLPSASTASSGEGKFQNLLEYIYKVSGRLAIFVLAVQVLHEIDQKNC